MHKPCGKTGQKLRFRVGKAWGARSTMTRSGAKSYYTKRVKALFLHESFPLFYHYISPLKNSFSPLFEHYFYPVSTAPTINNIKEK
jgi:hypothetical protein